MPEKEIPGRLALIREINRLIFAGRPIADIRLYVDPYVALGARMESIVWTAKPLEKSNPDSSA